MPHSPYNLILILGIAMKKKIGFGDNNYSIFSISYNLSKLSTTYSRENQQSLPNGTFRKFITDNHMRNNIF